ncbi:YdcF family protein [Bacillus songklensis]|uniref:YdcF family protein n=1 Tax=Bacillus songklensis TaxID=1069116 RepID=A0ABV8B647_9BACI
MLYITKFIYGFLLPPGIFILLLLGLSIWLYRQHRWEAKCLFIITMGLYVSSIPYVGDRLIHSLEKRYEPPHELYGDVIVMLGGGATSDTPDITGPGHLSGSAANRLLTAARLYRETELPIIVSGGSVFSDTGIEAEIAKRQLIDLGVPKDRIITETKSLNTKQNALNTKAIMDRLKLKHPILVTSAFHMERSILNFERAGMKVQPYPTDYKKSFELRAHANNFVPTGSSYTGMAMKEYLGILTLPLQW